MSNINKAGELPKIEIGQGRQKVIASVPSTPKAKQQLPAKDPATVSKKASSGTVNGIVFTPKPKNGKGSSIYLQKATWAKVDSIKDEYGLSRSEVLETLLTKALGIEN